MNSSTPDSHNSNPQPLTRRRFIQRAAAASVATTYGMLAYRAAAEESGPNEDQLCYITIGIKKDPATGEEYDYGFGDQDGGVYILIPMITPLV